MEEENERALLGGKKIRRSDKITYIIIFSSLIVFLTLLILIIFYLRSFDVTKPIVLTEETNDEYLFWLPETQDVETEIEEIEVFLVPSLKSAALTLEGENGTDEVAEYLSLAEKKELIEHFPLKRNIETMTQENFYAVAAIGKYDSNFIHPVENTNSFIRYNLSNIPSLPFVSDFWAKDDTWLIESRVKFEKNCLDKVTKSIISFTKDSRMENLIVQMFDPSICGLDTKDLSLKIFRREGFLNPQKVTREWSLVALFDNGTPPCSLITFNDFRFERCENLSHGALLLAFREKAFDGRKVLLKAKSLLRSLVKTYKMRSVHLTDFCGSEKNPWKRISPMITEPGKEVFAPLFSKTPVCAKQSFLRFFFWGEEINVLECRSKENLLFPPTWQLRQRLKTGNCKYTDQQKQKYVLKIETEPTLRFEVFCLFNIFEHCILTKQEGKFAFFTFEDSTKRTRSDVAKAIVNFYGERIYYLRTVINDFK